MLSKNIDFPIKLLYNLFMIKIKIGCCENSGIMAHSSLTQTTVLKGAFNEDAGTKKEFFDNIKLQQEYAR